MMTSHECRVSIGLLPTPAIALVVVRCRQAAKLQAFISTRLEPWTIATQCSLLYGISDNLYRRLQAYIYAAARLITNTRRCEHITPVLQELGLHWLPLPVR